MSTVLGFLDFVHRGCKRAMMVLGDNKMRFGVGVCLHWEGTKKVKRNHVEEAWRKELEKPFLYFPHKVTSTLDGLKLSADRL